MVIPRVPTLFPPRFLFPPISAISARVRFFVKTQGNLFLPNSIWSISTHRTAPSGFILTQIWGSTASGPAQGTTQRGPWCCCELLPGGFRAVQPVRHRRTRKCASLQRKLPCSSKGRKAVCGCARADTTSACGPGCQRRPRGTNACETALPRTGVQLCVPPCALGALHPELGQKCSHWTMSWLAKANKAQITQDT